MKPVVLIFTLVLLVGCSEDPKPEVKSPELIAYEAQLAADREAAVWKQIDANFALSLKQQNAELENPEAYEPRIYQELPE